MLVFIDLETTGLDPETNVVLEVAAVITDDALNEVARFERVTTEAKHFDLSKVDPYVLKMHVDNGLWNASLLASDFYTTDATGREIVQPSSAINHVDSALVAFITDHVGLDEFDMPRVGAKLGPQLAGSTISFDRAFMQKHLPHAHRLLHYRNVDVTTFNETARRFLPVLHDGRPRSGPSAAHRAMPDVLESLNVYRYYVDAIKTAFDDAGRAA